jgi:trigger factor
LDETIEGMIAGAATTFSSALVAGDYAGREAEVSVTVRTVKERELPPVDDDFAQLASEFDTLDELRADLAQRLGRVKRMEQVVSARDKALEALVEAADVPAPEGVLRDEVDSRKQQMTDQLERMGATLDDYLAAEEKTDDELTADLTAAAQNGVRVQLLLDAFADAEKITVTDDEFGHEVVHRAQRAQLAPQQYYEQLVRAGLASSIAVDVRRGKALAALLEKITIKDAAGNVISLDELRGADEDHTGHDHD